MPPYLSLSLLSALGLTLSTKFAAFMVFSLLWRYFCFSKPLSPGTYLQSSNPVRIQNPVKSDSPTLADLSYPALLHLCLVSAPGRGSLPRAGPTHLNLSETTTKANNLQ